VSEGLRDVEAAVSEGFLIWQVKPYPLVAYADIVRRHTSYILGGDDFKRSEYQAKPAQAERWARLGALLNKAEACKATFDAGFYASANPETKVRRVRGHGPPHAPRLQGYARPALESPRSWGGGFLSMEAWTV
jgi:hypothetical protein